MKPTLAPLLSLSVFTATPALSQDNSFEFVVSNAITPEHPSATVEAWFRFNPEFYAFAGAVFDVSGSKDPGAWSDPEQTLDGPSAEDGVISDDGDSVSGIVSGQLHFPLGGFFADTSNPILVWRATWSTDDFSPRGVHVATATDFFTLYPKDGPLEPPYGSFAEGAGVIVVGAEACYADFTGDGVLDLFDFLAYVNAFNAGDPAADCDHGGSLDLFDFLCFVNAFNEGC